MGGSRSLLALTFARGVRAGAASSRSGRGSFASQTPLPLASLAAPAIVLAAALVLAASAAADEPRFATTVTDINRVGLTLSNYGFFGNNFRSRSPSLEYPLGSGYEHMSRAGLWVGAEALGDDGLFTGVTTAIVDNAQGSNGSFETEFTPVGNGLRQLSRIANSRFYSPEAISDQDFLCSYNDQTVRDPAGNQHERHRPLDILVEQRTLAFSLEVADAFVVARFSIVNQGPALRHVYLGLYSQFVSGDKNAYSTWPPSTGSGPGSWYYKTRAEFDSARRLYKEHYCAGTPYPEGCQFAYCPPWAGVMLLGVSPGRVEDKTVSLAWWTYSPGDTLRDSDAELYSILANPVRMDPRDCVPNTGCSPIMVMGVGPFDPVLPGDTLHVDYAFVAGMDEATFLRNADFAQFASDIHFVLPAPPPSPRLHVESGANRVDLFWDDSPEQVEDTTSPAPGHLDFEGYRVYLGLDRQNPGRVAQFDLPDTAGFNTGLETIRLETPRVFDGIPYRYHLSVPGLRDGFQYYGAITSYDVGDGQVPSLESGISQNKFVVVPGPRPGESARGVTVFPNPYRVEARWDRGAQVRDHYLWFANLPRHAMLRIFTLAGDLVFETRFDGDRYQGESARGLYDPHQDLDTSPPSLSGSSFAWNLITREGQAVASGLYVYAVEDLDRKAVSRGKFLVVKSDRESF